MRVSFICASFNYKDYISEAIESVISQGCPDWELIVFDDGPKDGSQELIANYAKNDKRIKFLTHPNNENKGLIETLKAASRAASGDWLAFIESDDILRPDYLSSKIKAFNDYNDAKLIFSGVDILGNKEIQENYIKIFSRRDDLIKNHFNIAHLLRENIIPTFSCAMIEKKIFNSLDFNSPIAQNIDWWLWAQVLAKHKVIYVNKNLSVWRRHGDSYISSINKAKMPDFNRKIFNFIFDNSCIFTKLFAKILCNTFIFFNSEKVRKLFGTPSRLMCNFILGALYKMNKMQADLVYYNL